MKRYEELAFTDDFMFCKVLTEHPDLCHQLLELVIGKKMGSFVRLDKQKPIEITADGKGIRFDVYGEDDTGTVFDCEMQALNTRNLPKRTRYYQGMMDLNLIERGADYNELKTSYIIFICPFDAFGKGLPKYTFQNRCLEDFSLSLGDESTKIFLCSENGVDAASEELKDFLNYLTGGTAQSPFVRALDDAVQKARNHEEWRMEYMTLLMRDQEMIRRGRAEMIMQMLHLGKTAAQIAEFTGISRREIEEIELELEQRNGEWNI